jgi:adenylate kinase
LRSAVTAGSELGQKAASFMKVGGLVPDDVVIGVVVERLGTKELKDRFMLDGFPRTVRQAEALDEALSKRGIALDAVLAFDAPHDLVVKRIAGRLSCPNCGSVFHEQSKPPREAGLCDVCSTRLIVREDDQPETVRKRLQEYVEKTAPLLEYYSSKGIVRKVDATGDVETVYLKVSEALGE